MAKNVYGAIIYDKEGDLDSLCRNKWIVAQNTSKARKFLENENKGKWVESVWYVNKFIDLETTRKTWYLIQIDEDEMYDINDKKNKYFPTIKDIAEIGKCVPFSEIKKMKKEGLLGFLQDDVERFERRGKPPNLFYCEDLLYREGVRLLSINEDVQFFTQGKLPDFLKKCIKNYKITVNREIRKYNRLIEKIKEN